MVIEKDLRNRNVSWYDIVRDSSDKFVNRTISLSSYIFFLLCQILCHSTGNTAVLNTAILVVTVTCFHFHNWWYIARPLQPWLCSELLPHKSCVVAPLSVPPNMES